MNLSIKETEDGFNVWSPEEGGFGINCLEDKVTLWKEECNFDEEFGDRCKPQMIEGATSLGSLLILLKHVDGQQKLYEEGIEGGLDLSQKNFEECGRYCVEFDKYSTIIHYKDENDLSKSFYGEKNPGLQCIYDIEEIEKPIRVIEVALTLGREKWGKEWMI